MRVRGEKNRKRNKKMAKKGKYGPELVVLLLLGVPLIPLLGGIGLVSGLFKKKKGGRGRK
tara:strand:+ start:304 stop:483 length:180 start_codon:yes stop_codon:yes gene_type:complete